MASVEYVTINVEKDLHMRIKLSATVAGQPINDYLKNVLDDKLVKIDSLK